MVDEKASTAAMRKIELEEVKAMARNAFEHRITALLGDVAKDFERTAVEFRRVYDAMATRKQKLWEVDTMLREYTEGMRRITGGGIDAYVSEVLGTAEDLPSAEDDAKFLKLFEKLTQERDPLRRALLAANAVRQLDGEIPSWKSKLAKIDGMSSRGDGNSNEVDVAAKMRIAVERKINALATRRRELAVIFGAAKKDVERKLSNLESKIKTEE